MLVPGLEVAGVVAAEGVAKCRLRGCAPAGARKALTQDALHGPEVRAGLECGLRIQAEALKVALVNLGKTYAVVPSRRLQCGGSGHRLGQIRGLAHQRTADNADGKWIAAALDLDQRTGCVLRHQWRAAEHKDGQVDHQLPPCADAASAAASAARRPCSLMAQAA